MPTQQALLSLQTAFFLKGYTGRSVRNRLKLTTTKKQSTHEYSCTIIIHVIIYEFKVFAVSHSLSHSLPHILLLVSFSNQQRGGVTFLYSVTVFCSWKKQLSRKETKRNVSSVRGIVFTVYSKCKVGNANDHENSYEAAVKESCFNMLLTRLPENFNWTELQGSAEKFSHFVDKLY